MRLFSFVSIARHRADPSQRSLAVPASYLSHLDNVWTTAQQQTAERVEAMRGNRSSSSRVKATELVDDAHARLLQIRRKARKAAGAGRAARG